MSRLLWRLLVLFSDPIRVLVGSRSRVVVQFVGRGKVNKQGTEKASAYQAAALYPLSYSDNG